MKETEKKVRKIIIINGPNLNLLGSREEKIYGTKRFDDVYQGLSKFSKKNNIELLYFQSNHEGGVVDKIQQSIGDIDFIIINPGALTHYSYSIHDVLIASKIPTIEVHISNIFKREGWRSKSVISPAVVGVISGLGIEVYKIALIYIIDFLKK